VLLMWRRNASYSNFFLFCFEDIALFSVIASDVSVFTFRNSVQFQLVIA